ncbi:MAG: hypothetical protein ACRDZO_23080 [Egibacteraceae bacterium]
MEQGSNIGRSRVRASFFGSRIKQLRWGRYRVAEGTQIRHDVVGVARVDPDVIVQGEQPLAK